MVERIILGAILVAAIVAAAVMFRRSYKRAQAGGACAGCPMAGDCSGAVLSSGVVGEEPGCCPSDTGGSGGHSSADDGGGADPRDQDAGSRGPGAAGEGAKR